MNSFVGVDPYLYDVDQWNDLSKDLKKSGHTLISIPQNLIDLVWGTNQPDRPRNIVFPLELKYTGMHFSEKLEKVREKMKEENADCLILTALDEIAYLYNLRGSDIDFNPVFFSYAAVTLTKAFLFIDESKLSSEAIKELSSGNEACNIKPYEGIIDFMENQISESGKIWISNKSSYALSNLVPNEKKIVKITPVSIMKAIKNPVEINGLIKCHIRDASALCRYFNWLESEAPLNTQSEVSGADKLQKLREEQDEFVGLSFTTISSSGPNAAIIHYSPSKETDRPITTDDIYLVDSGGQYK